jgi:hypothetical protein
MFGCRTGFWLRRSQRGSSSSDDLGAELWKKALGILRVFPEVLVEEGGLYEDVSSDSGR